MSGRALPSGESYVVPAGQPGQVVQLEDFEAAMDPFFEMSSSRILHESLTGFADRTPLGSFGTYVVS